MRLLSSLLILASGLAAAEPPAKGLSKETAARRAALIRNVRYDLSFAIDADSPTFSGRAMVSFTLAKGGEALTLDFSEGKIESLEINGQAASPRYDGQTLTLPADALKPGANRVAVAFSHPYSNSSTGFYRSKDPADGRSYVYTDFEPFDAHALFPCFDQPDLKAPYRLQVEAPLDWQVISTMRESEVRKAPGARRLWVFPESPKLSTYIYSLHAGPYASWSASAEGVPLRLFARQSIAEHVPVEEWLKLTAQGLKFFNAYFDIPYPFGKYDQVIVPDFLSGAMENAAAVTFSERYLSRGKATWREREDLAGTLVHEMAHMWFGDLVTMRWWDDLWLNESFATIMASMALAEATEFKDAWLDFLLSDKQWAYWEDQLVTTHPIEAPVPDTEQAFANFDGITYGKGASTLKQVVFLLGADGFREGVRRYLKDFSYANATRRDFTGALAKASGRPLDAWSREWLETAGLNSLKAEFDCKDGRVSSFKLLQTAPADQPTMRSHRTSIGCYERKDGKLVLSAQASAAYSGASTPVPELAGKPCPALVLPNQDDHDYVKVRLDPASLSAAKESLSSVVDDLTRATLWMSLWEMVRDAELPVTAYAELVLRHLPAEKDFQLAAKVAETVYGRRIGSSSVLNYLGSDEEPWRKAFAERTARFEELFVGLLEKAEPGSDLQKLWFDSHGRVARTPEGRKRLKEALAGRGLPAGLALDDDRRWKLVSQLNRAGDPDGERLLEAEKKRDGSRRGQLAAIEAEAIRPEPAVKNAWLKTLLKKDSRPFEELRTAMRSLFPPEQAALRRGIAEQFYPELKTMTENRPNQFLDEFSDLAPVDCRPAAAGVLGGFIADNSKLPAVVLKNLKVLRQEDERCQRVRALAGPALSTGR